jgi:hypothetical protein
MTLPAQSRLPVTNPVNAGTLVNGVSDGLVSRYQRQLLCQVIVEGMLLHLLSRRHVKLDAWLVGPEPL